MTDGPVVVFDPAKDAKFGLAERSLEENEQVIRTGLGTFVDVGQALLDIRDSGQYREAGFSTFKEYCQARWGFGESWAHEHMAGAKVCKAIGLRDREVLPANLTQAKPLAPLLNSHGEEAVRNAWNQIVESHQGNGAITGREIRAFLNPSVAVAPSKRPMSDAYLSALDRVEAAVKALRWAVETHEGKSVPKPVAERFAEHLEDAKALADTVEAIAGAKST